MRISKAARITRSRAAKDTLDAMMNYDCDDPDRLALVFIELAALFKNKKTMNKRKFNDWLYLKLDD